MYTSIIETAERRARLINLTLLLFFLPFGVLGSNFHSFFHGKACGHQLGSVPSLMADVLACLDAPNRALDDAFLAIERYSSEKLSVDSAVTACPDEVFESSSYETNLAMDAPANELPSADNSLTYDTENCNGQWITNRKLTSGPARAGPNVGSPAVDCESDCQLSFSVRQLTISTISQVGLAAGDFVTEIQLSCQCISPSKVFFNICSRGPPSAI